jgi:uncharacterized membrane protein
MSFLLPGELWLHHRTIFGTLTNVNGTFLLKIEF